MSFNNEIKPTANDSAPIKDPAVDTTPAQTGGWQAKQVPTSNVSEAFAALDRPAGAN